MFGPSPRLVQGPGLDHFTNDYDCAWLVSMQRLLAGATAQISAGCPILRASEGENSDVCFGLVIPQPFLTERLGHPNVSIAW